MERMQGESFEDNLEAFKRCMTAYDEYVEKAQMIVRKYRDCPEFDIEYIDFGSEQYDNMVTAHGYEYDCPNCEHDFPVEMLFYTEDDFKKLDADIKIREEKRKKEYDERVLAEKRKEYEHLKAIFEKE